MKKIKILIFIIILIFTFNINVKASVISCVYGSGENKITISIEDINTLRSQYTDSYGTTQVFYPINFVNWFNSVNNQVSFGIGGNYNEQSACPKSITTYYNNGDKPFTPYLSVLSTEYEAGYNMNGKKIPIILFSAKGTTNDNKDVTLKIIQVDANYSSIENVYKSKATYSLQSKSNPTPGKETEQYIQCDYKSINAQYKFTFYKNKMDGHGYQLNGNGSYNKIRLDDIVSNSFSTCPAVIKLNDSRTMFKITDADNCPYENSLCIYRTDVSPYYSNDAQKSYQYKLLNGNEILTVSVLKDSQNSLKITNASNEEIKANNQDSYLSAFQSGSSLPNYLIKEKNSNIYRFDNEKPTEFDKIYVNSLSTSNMLSLGKEEIYKTCEDLFGNELLKWLDDNVFMLIRIIVPIILIVLTSFDFAKVVFSNDKDLMPNALSRFYKRAIAAVLIFLTPTIILTISNLVGSKDINSCVEWFNNNMEESN